MCPVLGGSSKNPCPHQDGASNEEEGKREAEEEARMQEQSSGVPLWCSRRFQNVSLQEKKQWKQK